MVEGMVVANLLLVIAGMPFFLLGGLVGLGVVIGIFFLIEQLWRGGRLLVGLPHDTRAETAVKEQAAWEKKLWEEKPWTAVKLTEAEMLAELRGGRGRETTPEYGAAANRKFERMRYGSPGRRRDHTHYSFERRLFR